MTRRNKANPRGRKGNASLIGTVFRSITGMHKYPLIAHLIFTIFITITVLCKANNNHKQNTRRTVNVAAKKSNTWKELFP